MMFGKQGLKEGQSLVGHILSTPSAQGLRGEFNSLKKEDREILTHALGMRTPVEELEAVLAKLGANPDSGQMERIVKVLRKLQEAANTVGAETKGMQQAFDQVLDEDEPGNYLVSHLFRGTHRQRVIDGSGKLIGMGSGNTKGEAIKSAQNLAERWSGHLDPKGPHSANYADDARDFKKISKRQKALFKSHAEKEGLDPTDFRISKGMGHLTGHEEPLTANEIFDIVHSTVNAKYKYMAEQTVKEQIMPEALEVFHKYGKKTFDALTYRINAMFSVKGPVNKFLNQQVDKVLAPILGQNSADRLVGGINKAEMHLSLMMGNLAHPLTNLLTFVQTTMPKMAYVMGTEPGKWGDVLGYGPDLDLNGVPRGIKGVFEPLKIALLAWKDMAKPDKELRAAYDRAAGDGVITAGIQEHFVGENPPGALGAR